MKFAWNIFCVSYLIVLLAVGAGGFALVETTTSSLTESQIERVLASNTYAAKLFFALAEQEAVPQIEKLQNQVAQITEIGQTDRLQIYSDASRYDAASFASQLSASEQGYLLEQTDGQRFLRAVCRVDLAEDTYYVETLSDLSAVYLERDKLIDRYLIGVLLIALVSGAALLGVSFLLARPLRRLSQAANRIAAGDYRKRIPSKTGGLPSEEIRKLSVDFNSMADAVEQNINRLQAELESRERFVAAFTHELKTPMTSMIGYADLLRSYDLDSRERREAADAIYREGKRLERLSMQLLDLLVLSHDAPPLEPVGTPLLFHDLSVSTIFLSQKYGVKIEFLPDNATVLCEPTLLRSLLYNLIDNACKASDYGSKVNVVGVAGDGQYHITVSDTGRGIAKEHLANITEPFYREDRARSRKQGGAGLGLALCKQIAAIHGTGLTFQSEQGKGTKVSFSLQQVDDTAPSGGEAL